jgi:hypothetical protein
MCHEGRGVARFETEFQPRLDRTDKKVCRRCAPLTSWLQLVGGSKSDITGPTLGHTTSAAATSPAAAAASEVLAAAVVLSPATATGSRLSHSLQPPPLSVSVL